VDGVAAAGRLTVARGVAAENPAGGRQPKNGFSRSVNFDRKQPAHGIETGHKSVGKPAAGGKRTPRKPFNGSRRGG
jgi:hypothetical protein